MRTRNIVPALLACLLFTVPTWAQRAVGTGALENIDVRYRPDARGRLPNDIDIFLYGASIKPEHIQGTFNTDILLRDPGDPDGPKIGLQWGQAEVTDEGINQDPNSPAFGLPCIRIRWAGPERPDLNGKLVHIGYRLKRGIRVEHRDITWTFDNEPTNPGCDPHIIWICERDFFLVCIANPSPFPIYPWGCRRAPLPLTGALPALRELNRFDTQGLNFTQVPLPGAVPGGPRTICIQPWCRIYFKIPTVNWRPVIVQVPIRDQPDEGETPLPPNITPDLAVQDERTMAVGLSQVLNDNIFDVNCDGVVGIPDFASAVGFRPNFGFLTDDPDADQTDPTIEPEDLQGGPDDEIRVNGKGFGNDPDDLCIVAIQPDGTLIPFRAEQVAADHVIARALPQGQDPTPGPLKVVRGTGARFGPQDFDIPDVRVEEAWAWQAIPGAVPAAGGEFTPNPGTGDDTVEGGPNARGDACCIDWDRDVPAGTKLNITCRLWATDGHPRLDCHCCVVATSTLTPQNAANRICDAIEAAYAAAGITVNCTDNEDPPMSGSFKICVSFSPAEPVTGVGGRV